MKRLQGNRTLFLAGLFIAVCALFAAMAPAYADFSQQVTPAAPTLAPNVDVTNIVPATGEDGGFDFPGWILMALFGLVIVILLVTLMIRGSNSQLE